MANVSSICSSISRCCPVVTVVTPNRVSASSRSITGASLITSGRVPKQTMTLF
jgi:hypothetical protein